MENVEITLNKIRNRGNLDDSTFLKLYQKLIVDKTALSKGEKFYLLKIAIYFLNSDDKRVEQLGYRIILSYSNKFGDYNPLYDVAFSREYIPITKFIEKKYSGIQALNLNFSSLFLAAYQENFRSEQGDGRGYRSRGQIVLSNFSSSRNNVAIVAPTSYGKSEIMINKIKDYLGKKVCIIVPSKALLAQTKQGLLRNSVLKNSFRKIVTHPDMYRSSDQSFLAVLTQERLLRLLQTNKDLAIDVVMVDEAHNLLEDDVRWRLLAQVLLILKKRKSDFLLNFFTPFLSNVQNLKITHYENNINGKSISEYMKTEKFYIYDFRKEKKLSLYDQFLDKEFVVGENTFRNEAALIAKHKAGKNILYLNRPKDAESFALQVSVLEENILLTKRIQKTINSISELIHPDYNLIKCIKKGIVYHHGGIPDMIRLYIEEIFAQHECFHYIVTTSTLLEGVNIPAEKIFLLTPTKGKGYLTASQFKNLIGRICRFREVFDPNNGNLKMLEPEVYLLGGSYSRKNFSPIRFYRKTVNLSKEIKDDVENPLLENSTNQEERQKSLEYLENMEPGSSGLSGVEHCEFEIGRLCFENNVYDFDILKNERTLVSNLNKYKEIQTESINTVESLVDGIFKVFLENIDLDVKKTGNMSRLKENQKARNFYGMFIGWRARGAPYPLMINSFLNYWKTIEDDDGGDIYVGSTWGEKTRDGYQELFVNIKEKTEPERINLAIAKIKEEQDFVDFSIMKYVEILNGLQLCDSELYDRVKYGTSNKQIICMLKNGFSMDLAKLLATDYASLVNFDLEQDIVNYTHDLIKSMRDNNENEILIFEAETNLS